MKTVKQWMEILRKYNGREWTVTVVESDISDIQRDALREAVAIADRYQSSMGTAVGMQVAYSIWKELKELLDRHDQSA